jgi:hypothetical protein
MIGKQVAIYIMDAVDVEVALMLYQPQTVLVVMGGTRGQAQLQKTLMLIKVVEVVREDIGLTQTNP